VRPRRRGSVAAGSGAGTTVRYAEIPEATVKAAVGVDHTDHEALVAVPLQSEEEIVGECRFVRLADQPDAALIRETGKTAP
jgi:hypothetical protein